VVMAKFARDCLAKMQVLVRQLEVTLGPDTADLAIRVGLHSGPVTAGVLRGERARFQLFGDTMNTAARIETSGMRDKIHISGETADLLIEADKANWFHPREDVIVAKGKGALQTYWLTTKDETRSKNQSSNPEGGEATTASDENMVETEAEAINASRTVASMKLQRLIDWNCELLLQLLKKIVARRNVTKRKSTSPLLSDRLKKKSQSLTSSSRMETLEMELGLGATALDEVCEIITLPNFDAKAASEELDPKTIDLGDKLAEQLRDFVSVIASMYRDNPFHCFEHASHVTMSVSKLLSRIAAPDSVESEGEMDMASALHDHTYGITSDPLTQFSVVMAALIHDVDHRGVPNFVLCKEEPNLAATYKEKSVAEQNSVDLAWNALMDPSFAVLRRCIYGDETEMKRFRQLLVNSVMATDIFDKELGLLRKKRWDKAFQEGPEGGSREEDTNRKATIVIEHLIQASDVAHTMQHWHVYQKWNARLFQEMYSAFLSGRCDKDPSEGWYQGEIGFFDHYIIPLAMKLKECGVFGVASDEYLSYATNNRREWETKGAAAVVALVEKCHAKHLDTEGKSGVPIQNPAANSVGANQA
jgi:hypothetical protein